MEYGICNLAVVPLRADANERSEQISQVLFGETFDILEWTNNWVKITTTIDDYTGWIGRLQFCMLSHMDYKQQRQEKIQLTYGAVTQAWKIADNSVIYLPVGSSLSFLEGTTCHIGNEKLEIIGDIGKSDELDTIAKSFLNTPYLWGGRTHFGIDCSGFTQAVFRLMGRNITRDASMQVNQGNVVNSSREALLGDLAFFNNPEGKITHVGIILDHDLIIHASGMVKIDQLDEKGIYSKSLKRYTHPLHSIKRFF